MCPSCVETPLPETVSFLPENFGHLVKLQLVYLGRRIGLTLSGRLLGTTSKTERSRMWDTGATHGEWLLWQVFGIF